ncbi:MAG: arginine--tRNA ligase, partial [Clostridia bacterium]|nr:arginine--tRNA ligase [Clostridia bacterium]
MKDVKQELAQVVASATGVIAAEDALRLFETPPDPTKGDIAFPCFRLSKFLRKPPAVIAQELAEQLELPDVIEKAEPVNGYLNFFIRPSYYAQALASLGDHTA